MLAPHLFCAALAILAAGCGQIGVELRALDAGVSSAGAAGTAADGGSSLEAGVLNDSGSLAPNSPSDAGSGVGGGSDAGVIANDAASGTDAGLDAAPNVDAAVDAGTDAAVDAGTDAAVDAGAPAPCSGRSVLDVCWYLGAAGASCDDTCTSHGGFDPRAAQHVGTTSQGGSNGDCRQILTALGKSGSVTTATRSDNNGFGCHIWNDGSRYWLDDPSPHFRASVSAPVVRIACGCAR
jgi:hypothetical protein